MPTGPGTYGPESIYTAIPELKRLGSKLSTKPDPTPTDSGAAGADRVLRNLAPSQPAPAPATTSAPDPAPAPSQPTQPTRQSSQSSSGTSGSGVTSGGSGGGSSGTPLTSMQQRMRTELDTLESDRNAARAELMEQFALAPTQQEKDAISRQMADIERRYQEGRQMVQLAYQDASEDVGARVSDTRARKQSEMQAMLDMLEGSARRTDDITSVAEGRDAAYGVGATIGGTQGADPYAAEIAALAQIEAGLSGQLNDITAADQQWVLDMLAMEAPAAQGELRRAAEDRSSAAQREHEQRVQQRIAAERAQMNQLLAGLNSDFMQRESGLEQALLQAELRQQELAQQAALARASRAAAGSGRGADDAAPVDLEAERLAEFLALSELDPDDQRGAIALGAVDPVVAQALQGNLPTELSAEQWQRAQAVEANDMRRLQSLRDRFGG